MSILDNRLFVAAVSIIGGAILTIVIQKITNKRGLFTYSVQHNIIGVSADDSIFGSVQVIWDNNPVTHLYLSTIELVNQSMTDYESVIVRVFTSSTLLLTEKTELVNTSHVLEWSDDYKAKVEVPAGQKPSEDQVSTFLRQRDYEIPTLNRGQVVRFQYLNSADTEKGPSIWLDIIHKGVKLKFRVVQSRFLGVPQSTAALAGSVLGVIFLGFVIAYAKNIWSATIVAFLFGLFAQIPGAYLIKGWYRLRDLTAN